MAGLIGFMAAAPVQALQFNLGEVEGRFDSQLSIGASWRVEGRDDSLISGHNGGRAAGNGVNDDGDLNFDSGETFSRIFKGVHDLDLSYQNLGFFGRGKYWYDFELENGNQPWGHGPNGYAAGAELNDAGFNDYAKFSGAEILDAFVYGNFELGDQPLDLRLGRQVVNWGESTFIRGGLSSVNPVDVAAFRRPGAEIKEGLLPSNMLFANLGITDNASLEAFYQLKFEKTVIDGCGTYFSTVDYVGQGCNTLTLGSLGPVPDGTAVATGRSVSRNSDGIREADDEGQYGLALRYYAEALNATEFGFYFMNYHSRLPVASGVSTGSTQLTAGFPFIPGNTLGQNPTYFTEYPEDIRLLGLSFATNLGEFALSGELSHHRDMPLQINGADLVASILTAGMQAGNPVNSRVQAANAETQAKGKTSGTVVQGYDRYDVTQAQLTLVRFIDQVAGASRLALVGELGYNHIHDFANADQGGIRYGRASEFGQAGTDGFVTQDSWGYRARAIFSYNDVFSGVNLKPSIAWSHDVHGYSPASTGFNQGSKALSLGLDADYLNTYTAGIAYTRFSGGTYNTIKDRDFIAASLGMAF